MIKQTIKHVEETAPESYRARQVETLRLLKQIKDGLEKHDHRAHSFGEPHWGHVGDLTSIIDTLKDLSDRLHLTGEYTVRN